MEIFKRFSIVKYYKTETCNDCDKCRKICELETRPEEANCTNCAACAEVCPVDAIKLGWKKERALQANEVNQEV